MRRLFLIAMLGCGGSTPALAPAPAAAPVAVSPAESTAEAPHAAPAEQVATKDQASSDPSEGGEGSEVTGTGGVGVSGTGPGGGGTGIGLGTTAGMGTDHGHLGNVKRAGEPSTAAGPASVAGGLSPDVIDRVVRSRSGKIRSCFQEQLLKKPGLAGKILVKFTIGKTGTITNAKSAGVDPEVDTCVNAVFNAMRFPPPTGGGVVNVNYPLIMIQDR